MTEQSLRYCMLWAVVRKIGLQKRQSYLQT